MKNFKPPNKQVAFTLLELIVVIVILAILSSYVLTRSTSSDAFHQDTVIEQIISVGQLAQHLSMNDSSRTFSLAIQAKQINLLADGSTLNAANFNFPLIFDDRITLSPVTNIVFDNSGQTTNLTINISSTSDAVCFETSGYIHKC